MKYLLDTNICIAYLSAQDFALNNVIHRNKPNDLLLCSIVRAELLFGAQNSRLIANNLAIFNDFFERFESLPFDDKAASQYAIIKTVLKKAGTPIGPNDLLIASIALTHNLTLVTRNHREFSMVPHLKIEEW